jgi:hypothetical protein
MEVGEKDMADGKRAKESEKDMADGKRVKESEKAWQVRRGRGEVKRHDR